MILHDDRSLLALQGPEAAAVLQVGTVYRPWCTRVGSPAGCAPTAALGSLAT